VYTHAFWACAQGWRAVATVDDTAPWALRQARLAATPEHLGEAVAALTRAATDYDKATLME
jgi:hypothetical protein